MLTLGCSMHDILGSNYSENMKHAANAGFKSIFALWNDDMDTEAYMNNAAKCGLTVESFHAPFVDYNSIWAEGSLGDRETEKIKKCIREAAKYGVPNVVSHVVSDIDVPVVSHLGLTRYGKIVVEAMKYNVQLSFENTQYIRHLGQVMEYFEYPGFCYDTGHEHCYTPGIRYMPLFGDRLQFVHLHDNMGLNKSYLASHADDLHRIPFDGNIDWEKTLREIKSFGFDGTLMLECDPAHDMNMYGKLSAEEYYNRAFEGAKKLRELYESL